MLGMSHEVVELEFAMSREPMLSQREEVLGKEDLIWGRKRRSQNGSFIACAMAILIFNIPLNPPSKRETGVNDHLQKSPGSSVGA